MSGLFGTFNVSKRGLFAQQKALDTTSHNVANANTEGYSRQRAIMETTTPFGMPSMNNEVGPGQMGTGVEIAKIQRVRDTFMDYQVRRENSTLGQYGARDKYLSEIEGIMNEPSENGLSTLITKFFNGWDDLSLKPESSNARTVVAQQAAALADELNHTYSQLTKVKENAQSSIKQGVYDVNAVLNRVDKLNQQIMSVKISGMEPNDLMDKRDMLLDELSEKFNIDVEADKFYSVNVKPKYTNSLDGGTVENPLLVRKNPNDAVRRFSYVTSVEPTPPTIPPTPPLPTATATYKVSYLKNGDKDKPATFELTITSNKTDKKEAKAEIEEKFKRLEQCRVIWSQSDKNNEDIDGLAIKADGTEIKEGDTIDFNDLALFELKEDNYRGELKGFMSVQKDVDVYKEQLDKLAKALAFSVNSIHSGQSSAGTPVDSATNPPDADYMPFFVNKEAATGKYTTVNGKHVLYDGTNVTNLNAVLTAEKDITAGNITINRQILDDVMQIKTRKNDDEFKLASENNVDGESDGARALAIAQLRNTLMKIQDIDKGTTRKKFIETMTGDGTNGVLTEDTDLGLETIKSNINGMKVDNYFKDTVDKLGVQEQEARRIVSNQESLLQEFEQRRASISGVSLNEEMANLVQFQHAYQANAKVISTVDELLDVVVNGLKR